MPRASTKGVSRPRRVETDLVSPVHCSPAASHKRWTPSQSLGKPTRINADARLVGYSGSRTLHANLFLGDSTMPCGVLSHLGHDDRGVGWGSREIPRVAANGCPTPEPVHNSACLKECRSARERKGGGVFAQLGGRRPREGSKLAVRSPLPTISTTPVFACGNPALGRSCSCRGSRECGVPVKI